MPALKVPTRILVSRRRKTDCTQYSWGKYFKFVQYFVKDGLTSSWNKLTIFYKKTVTISPKTLLVDSNKKEKESITVKKKKKVIIYGMKDVFSR